MATKAAAGKPASIKASTTSDAKKLLAVTALASAALAGVSDGVRSAVAGVMPAFVVAGWDSARDLVTPVPDTARTRVRISVYNPTANNSNLRYDASLVISGAECKAGKSPGVSPLYSPSGGPAIPIQWQSEFFRNATVQISCQRSGKTTVTLYPRPGVEQVLYSGVPGKEPETRTVPGVAGSYGHAVVVVERIL